MSTVCPQSAAIVARLLAGQSLNGELEGLPHPLGRIARRLNSMAPNNREDAWNGFLSVQDDESAIVQAVAAAPVDGPLPPAQGPGNQGGPDRCDPASPCNGRWPEGMRVQAHDRDNFGTVVSDEGDRVRVRFVSPTGREATISLPKTQLTPLSNDVERDGAEPFRLRIYGATELSKADFRMQWHVRRILVRDQPCVLAGPKKILKTTIAVDLAVSLAAGQPFLNAFEVPEPVCVLLISGESGGFVIQETVRRVCRSKGIQNDFGSILEGRLFTAFDLPALNDPAHLAGMNRLLRMHAIGVVVIDPLYLSLLRAKLPGQRVDASNLFDMGPLFQSIAQSCLDAGATPVLLHHFSKAGTATGEMPGLESMAFAGCQEFARQWVLLGRRSTFESGSGKHELWMTVGGSAGHSGEWALDVDEGVLKDDFSGRKWDPIIRPASEAATAARGQKQAEKEQAKRRAGAEDAQTALVKLRGDGPSTKTEWREALGWSSKRLDSAIAVLLEERAIRRTTKHVHAGEGQRAVQAWEAVPESSGSSRDENDL